MPSLFDIIDEPAQQADTSAMADSEHDYTANSDLATLEATIDEAVKAGRVGVTLYAIGSDDMTSRWMGRAI